MNPNDILYKYRAKVLRVIDGDTIVVEIDHGFRVFSHQTLRLFNINAPEVRGPEKEKGKAATDHLVKLLISYAANYVNGKLKGDCSVVYIETHKDRTGKYGRYLAELWGVDKDGNVVNLNEQMISDGYAVEIFSE